MIQVAQAWTHRSKGSVRIFVPAPLDRGELDMTSCSASEAGTNVVSSNSIACPCGVGFRSEMSTGINGVISLTGASSEGDQHEWEEGRAPAGEAGEPRLEALQRSEKFIGVRGCGCRTRGEECVDRVCDRLHDQRDGFEDALA